MFGQTLIIQNDRPPSHQRPCDDLAAKITGPVRRPGKAPAPARMWAALDECASGCRQKAIEPLAQEGQHERLQVNDSFNRLPERCSRSLLFLRSAPAETVQTYPYGHAFGRLRPVPVDRRDQPVADRRVARGEREKVGRFGEDAATGKRDTDTGSPGTQNDCVGVDVNLLQAPGIGKIVAYGRRSGVSAQAMSTFFIALAFAVMFAVYGGANAFAGETRSGSYKLTGGARYLLCRRFLENLNSFPKLGRFPLEIPIRDDLPYFRKPKWTPLDPKQHFDLVKRLTVRELSARKRDVRYPSPKDDQKAWEAEEDTVRKEIDTGLLRLEQTRLDFDHDGQQEMVYRFGRPLGDPPEIPWSYHVLVPPGPGRPPSLGGRSGLDISTHLEARKRFDSFFHEGRFYLIGLRGPYSGPVIYEPRAIMSGTTVAITPVCRFRRLRN